MGARTSTTGHQSSDRVALNRTIGKCLVAEILERLSISFADHLVLRVTVKHPNHLPGISICSVIFYCIMVIRNQITDSLFEILKLGNRRRQILCRIQYLLGVPACVRDNI